MSSTLRSTQVLQITKMDHPIYKSISNDLILISKSSEENIDFVDDQFKDCSFNSASSAKYKFSTTNSLLLSSLLSLLVANSCQVLCKKISTSTLSHNLSLSSCDESSDRSSYSSSNTTSLNTRTKSNSSSWILDFDKANYSVSLLNLDVEDCELISDMDQLEFDHLQSSGFPSPSYKMVSWPAGRHSSSSSINTITTYEVEEKRTRPKIALEAGDFEDLDTDGPLFWPFERKFDWNSKETWSCFTMSPRKNIEIFPSSSPPDHDPHNFELISLHERKRPLFKLGSAASNKIMERRQRNGNRTNSHSRFSQETKDSSAKLVPLEAKNDINNVVEYSKSGKRFPLFKKSDSLDRNYFLGKDFGSKEELPIEMLLGLDEFDGHEGVESEFNQDDFSLDESLS